jgi:hypothetical protein
MAAEHGLNMIHFDFAHIVTIKDEVIFNYLKNGIFYSLAEEKALHLRLDS